MSLIYYFLYVDNARQTNSSSGVVK